MNEMEMWENEGTNEWTSSEKRYIYIYIYYVWILSEWVNECPKIADGVNELVKYNTVYSSYDGHDNPVHV